MGECVYAEHTDSLFTTMKLTILILILVQMNTSIRSNGQPNVVQVNAL